MKLRGEGLQDIKASRTGEEATMPNLEEYLARYEHEHANPRNKVFHGIGIPIIFAGIILLVLMRLRFGLALLILGWILLFAGHRIEGNKPAFFRGPIYFLVGPIWVAKELFDSLRGRSRGAPEAD